MTHLEDVVLIWGTPSDVELHSEGGGEYASSFKLTPRGVSKITDALLWDMMEQEGGW